ncbi:hypothetical protein D3C81_1807200 [compost metagenome]
MTVSIIGTGQLSRPRQAPSMAPRIAAMVSVSPPRLAAMHNASNALISPTATCCARAKETTTDSCDATEVPITS